MKHYKTGRRPAVHTLRSMRKALALAPFLDALGTPPTTPTDYVAAVVAQYGSNGWGMLGNDQWGCCLPSGTAISATSINSGYRVRYDGPLVRIRCASGKALAITPNHAVLTPRGFIRAKHLKKGDDLVGTSRPEILPGLAVDRGQRNVNYLPAAIEEIFASLGRRRDVVGKVMPVSVDFHGDQEFFDGDIDVVSTNRFLRDKLDSALGEPHSKHKISTASKLKRHFACARSSLHRAFRAFGATYGDISFGGYRSAFAYSHSGIAQSERLGLRSQLMTSSPNGSSELSIRNFEFPSQRMKRLPGDVPADCFSRLGIFLGTPDGLHDATRSQFKASSLHPSIDGIPTDPELFFNLRKAMPGLIETDRVIDVQFDSFEGHVFDLSTSSRWFVANGIIAHNCVEASDGHQLMLRTANVGNIVIPTTDDVLGIYSAETGFNQSDGPSGNNPTDQGSDETTDANFMVSAGLLGHKAAGTGMIDPTNMAHIKWAVQLFGCCQLGVVVDESMEEDFDSLQPWETAASANNPTAGGHGIPIVSYDDSHAYIVTWGGGNWSRGLQPVAWSLMQNAAFLDEAHALVFPDFVKAGGTAPSGFDLDGLLAKLQQIEMQQAA